MVHWLVYLISYQTFEALLYTYSGLIVHEAPSLHSIHSIIIVDISAVVAVGGLHSSVAQVPIL